MCLILGVNPTNNNISTSHSSVRWKSNTNPAVRFRRNFEVDHFAVDSPWENYLRVRIQNNWLLVSAYKCETSCIVLKNWLLDQKNVFIFALNILLIQNVFPFSKSFYYFAGRKINLILTNWFNKNQSPINKTCAQFNAKLPFEQEFTSYLHIVSYLINQGTLKTSKYHQEFFQHSINLPEHKNRNSVKPVNNKTETLKFYAN